MWRSGKEGIRARKAILSYLCCVVVTGRKLPIILQIIMTIKVIQWNRPVGTDSVCRDEAGNEHQAKCKEHCREGNKGGALQRWTEVEYKANWIESNLPTCLPILLFICFLLASSTLLFPISLNLSLSLPLLTLCLSLVHWLSLYLSLWNCFTDIQICTA